MDTDTEKGQPSANTEEEQGGEVCIDCGNRIEYVWTAPDDLWLRFANENDLLCLPCFDKRVWAEGVFIRWVPHVEVKGQQAADKGHRHERSDDSAYQCLTCGLWKNSQWWDGYDAGLRDGRVQ